MIQFIIGAVVVAKTAAIVVDIVGAETGAGTRRTFLKHAAGLNKKGRDERPARHAKLEEDLKLLRAGAGKGWRQPVEYKALRHVAGFVAREHLVATGEALSAIADTYVGMAADALAKYGQWPRQSAS
jgi:hypothetical protein